MVSAPTTSASPLASGTTGCCRALGRGWLGCAGRTGGCLARSGRARRLARGWLARGWLARGWLGWGRLGCAGSGGWLGRGWLGCAGRSGGWLGWGWLSGPGSLRLVWLSGPGSLRLVWLSGPGSLRLVWLSAPASLRPVWLSGPGSLRPVWLSGPPSLRPVRLSAPVRAGRLRIEALGQHLVLSVGPGHVPGAHGGVHRHLHACHSGPPRPIIATTGQKIVGHQGAGSHARAVESPASAPARCSAARPEAASAPSLVQPR